MDYYFSGSLPLNVWKDLERLGRLPICVLVTQIDRATLNKMFEYQKKGWISKLFVDSGAYTAHSKGITIDIDEYIDYLNEHDDQITICVEVDKIPGRLNQPKTKEDYIESADVSWKNFLYMRERMKSPQKLLPVFHYGESFDALRRMLEWTDKDGNHLDYINLSPANDTVQRVKDRYLQECYEVIRQSSNPNVKTHLLGMTSINGLKKVPCSSCDSVSTRVIAAYGKVRLPSGQIIGVTKSKRTHTSNDNVSFKDVADPQSFKEVEDYFKSLGYTYDEVADFHERRITVCMVSTMMMLEQNPHDKNSVVRTKNLFSK